MAALSWRMPQKISIARGRSICPKCKNIIIWYDNIPLFSFINLGGSCRKCKKKISLRYPLVELATGIAFVSFGPNPLLLGLACILILIFVIDFEHQIISDELVFSGIVFGLVLADNLSGDMFFAKLFAGVSGALFLLFLHFVTLGRGMGLGDVKLALLLGLLLGPVGALYGFFAAFLTGAIVGIILILSHRAKWKQKIAFGPFMIIGFVLAYFVG